MPSNELLLRNDWLFKTNWGRLSTAADKGYRCGIRPYKLISRLTSALQKGHRCMVQEESMTKLFVARQKNFLKFPSQRLALRRNLRIAQNRDLGYQQNASMTLR